MALIRKLGVEYGSFFGALLGSTATLVAGMAAWLGIQQQLDAQSTGNLISLRVYLSTEEDRLQMQKWAAEEARRMLLTANFIAAQSCSQNKPVLDFLRSDLFIQVDQQNPVDKDFIKNHLSGPASVGVLEVIFTLKAVQNMAKYRLKDDNLSRITEKHASAMCSDLSRASTSKTQDLLSQYITYSDFRQSQFQKAMIALDDKIGDKAAPGFANDFFSRINDSLKNYKLSDRKSP